jgi:hypothetical protein
MSIVIDCTWNNPDGTKEPTEIISLSDWFRPDEYTGTLISRIFNNDKERFAHETLIVTFNHHECTSRLVDLDRSKNCVTSPSFVWICVDSGQPPKEEVKLEINESVNYIYYQLTCFQRFPVLDFKPAVRSIPATSPSE